LEYIPAAAEEWVLSSFPKFPQLPDDDPIAAIRMFRRYLQSVIAYGAPKWAVAAIAAIVVVPTLLFAATSLVAGLDSALSWASDFVPLGFAFAGIAFSIRKLRNEHQSIVIAMIAIVGIMGTIILHLERTREASRLTAAIRVNAGILNKLNNPPTTLTPQEAAVQRLENIYKGLRGEYILSHTNISPGLLAGVENPPAEWLNSRLQQMGENWKFSEPTGRPTKEKGPTTPTTAPPEVALSFVDPEIPTLLIRNISPVVVHDGLWEVAVWNMDRPNDVNPLQIPTTAFSFIKPHSQAGPIDVFGRVSSALKRGDRLFGSAVVDCPECEKGKTYIVYIVWGVGGWFAEVKSEYAGQLIVPIKPSPETFPSFFASLENLVPVNARIPIGKRELETLH
jgi:hypothetical protein